MARVPVHSTREQWLETAVEALRPCLQEHAGLSVPRVRLSCGVHSRRRRGEVYIGKTVDNVAEVNISLSHTAEASSVLGTLMRLCIYVAAGSQAHRRNFQCIATQCGLVPLEGSWATAGYPDANVFAELADLIGQGRVEEDRDHNVETNPAPLPEIVVLELPASPLTVRPTCSSRTGAAGRAAAPDSVADETVHAAAGHLHCLCSTTGGPARSPHGAQDAAQRGRRAAGGPAAVLAPLPGAAGTVSDSSASPTAVARRHTRSARRDTGSRRQAG